MKEPGLLPLPAAPSSGMLTPSPGVVALDLLREWATGGAAILGVSDVLEELLL
jgi:hypothetical protein